MPEGPPGTLPDAMAAVRHVASIEYGRVVASVIGTVHDWTLAEDAVQDALTRAVERWPGDGVPANPAAWVTTVARRRAIDLVRHADAERRAVTRLEHEPHDGVDNTREADDHDDAFPHGDERLKLIFTACHPALTLEARAALTLRTVLNVSIEQLAGIFAVAPATMEKRLVRARAKIAHANIPYRVPDAAQLDSRSASVCEVLSALFTIGYSDPTLQPDPGAEAIRLARLCGSCSPRTPRLDSSSRAFSPSCSFSTPAARHARRPTACPCRSMNRIANCGMSPRSTKGYGFSTTP